jgi:pimeloyl-ACP methyl ester carboxylesterase
MKNKFYIILIVLAVSLLSGCQSLWYVFLDTVVDIAPDRFSFEEKSIEVSIPVFSSQILTISNNETEYLIVLIHGAGLNAGKTFTTGEQFAESLGLNKHKSIIVAPQFLEGVDPNEDNILVWGRTWRSGGLSLIKKQNKIFPEISSFDVLDRLLESVLNTHTNIHSIILLGHSAGGQFVLRYAAVNNQHESFEKRGVSIRYVVANPSSYLYLDSTRYQFSSDETVLKIPQNRLAGCLNYNNYKYGIDNLYGYSETLSTKIIRTRLLSRPLVFLIGKEDTGLGWSLDKSCEVEMQGKNRYERGQLYKYHLSGYFQDDNTSDHIWIEIPDVGHNAKDMFLHPHFIKKMIGVLLD